MTNTPDTWDSILAHAFDVAFGFSAHAAVTARADTHAWDTTDELAHHLRLADQVFEIVALVLHRAGQPAAPSPSRQVFDRLLPQIAQDLKAVGRLASSGFPYQAVTVAVSAFEHGVMLASIGRDDQRAERWLAHTDLTRNMDNVHDTVQRALKNLDRDFPGVRAQLRSLDNGKPVGPYERMYQPLCAFKHGNPVAQRHMHATAAVALPLSIFSAPDRRAIVVAFWAIEGAIRAAWFALIAFIPHHLPKTREWDPIMIGMNRVANALRAIREQKEQEPN
jgi:hypothetical protein